MVAYDSWQPKTTTILIIHHKNKTLRISPFNRVELPSFIWWGSIYLFNFTTGTPRWFSSFVSPISQLDVFDWPSWISNTYTSLRATRTYIPFLWPWTAIKYGRPMIVKNSLANPKTLSEYNRRPRVTKWSLDHTWGHPDSYSWPKGPA